MDASQQPDRPGCMEETAALRHLPSHLRFWIIGAAMLALDLWSKHHIFATLAPNDSKPFLANFVDFHRSLNDGAVFGSFTGQIGLFVAASVIALIFVVYLFSRCHRSQWIMQIALALVLSGALGNLYDRAMIKADVVTYTPTSGQTRTWIGKVVDETETAVRVGDWPDGGNPTLIDKKYTKIRSQGVVRDFIRFSPAFPNWVPYFGGRDVWPWVFNIADAALVIGVGILLISSWVVRHPEGDPRASAG